MSEFRGEGELGRFGQDPVDLAAIGREFAVRRPLDDSARQQLAPPTASGQGREIEPEARGGGQGRMRRSPFMALPRPEKPGNPMSEVVRERNAVVELPAASNPSEWWRQALDFDGKPVASAHPEPPSVPATVDRPAQPPKPRDTSSGEQTRPRSEAAEPSRPPAEIVTAARDRIAVIAGRVITAARRALGETQPSQPSAPSDAALPPKPENESHKEPVTTTDRLPAIADSRGGYMDRMLAAQRTACAREDLGDAGLYEKYHKPDDIDLTPMRDGLGAHRLITTPHIVVEDSADPEFRKTVRDVAQTHHIPPERVDRQLEAVKTDGGATLEDFGLTVVDKKAAGSPERAARILTHLLLDTNGLEQGGAVGHGIVEFLVSCWHGAPFRDSSGMYDVGGVAVPERYALVVNGAAGVSNLVQAGIAVEVLTRQYPQFLEQVLAHYATGRGPSPERLLRTKLGFSEVAAQYLMVPGNEYTEPGQPSRALQLVLKLTGIDARDIPNICSTGPAVEFARTSLDYYRSQPANPDWPEV